MCQILSRNYWLQKKPKEGLDGGRLKRSKEEPCVHILKVIYVTGTQNLARKENARHDGIYCRLLHQGW